MSDMERKEAIMWLKIMRKSLELFPQISNNKKKQALDMAIRSVETDEAYQLEYERTTKNDLGVDCVSRDKVMQILQAHWLNGTVAHRIIAEIGNDVQHLPSVTPQEPQESEVEDGNDD